MKNKCLKSRPLDNPYAIYISNLLPDWEWRVLKKWQVDDNKPYARWFCAVKSPMTYGEWEYGDVYVSEILNDVKGIPLCPKCKDILVGYPAISRRDNVTEICSNCGTQEALEDYTNSLNLSNK